MEDKKYEFDPTKIKWGDISCYVQELILDRIKEDEEMGPMEMSERLTFSADILFDLSCMEKSFLLQSDKEYKTKKEIIN